MNNVGTIQVSIADKSDQIFIDVSDTGKGIPKAYFKTVFQPGFTTKKRGWGLGLSLAKRIVEGDVPEALKKELALPLHF